MIMSRKRKWKSLTLKVEHLRLEVEERDELLKQFEGDFNKKLLELVDGLNGEEPVEETAVSTQTNVIDDGAPPPEVEPKKGEELPDDIKKLWKSIAALTHPDKTKNDPKKTKLYLEAAKAVNEGSIDEIIRIAIELDIEVPEASTASVNKLETIAKDLQQKISEAEMSVLWQWGNAKDADKQKIMELFIAMKRLKKKSSPPV